jgi:chemotaxis methyl-accepting protein methylase
LFAFSQPALQQRLLPRLQHALKHDGFLWTGSAGIFNNPGGVFLARDSEHKLYQRLPEEPFDLQLRH